MSSKPKLHYRFHNPNTPEAAADCIEKVFIEANTGKVERALQAAVNQPTFDHNPLQPVTMRTHFAPAKQEKIHDSRSADASDISEQKSCMPGG